MRTMVPFILAAEVKMAIGVCDRAFAGFVLLLPDGLACLEVLAGPAFVVRKAVKVFTNPHDASVMINHHLVVAVNFFRFKLAVA